MVVMTDIMTPMRSTKMVFMGSTWTNLHVMWKDLAAC